MDYHVNFDAKKIRTTFLVLGISLFVVSLVAHQLENWAIYRGLRGLISFVAAGLLLYYLRKRTSTLLFSFLVIYGCSSIATIWYEVSAFATASMMLNTVAFLLLLRLLLSLVSFKKSGSFMSIVFLIMISIVGYLMYEFVHMMQSFSMGSLHYAFILISAMVGVVNGFFTLLYNHNYASRSSLAFTLFFFLLLFAEVFRGIGYYDFAYGDIAVFIARILLIVATFLLVKYCLLVDANKTSLL